MAKTDLDSLRALLRGSFTTSVAEPIAEAHWRRAARLFAVACFALVASDVALQIALWVGAYAGPSVRAYQRFIYGHASANVLGLLVCLWALFAARSEPARRGAMRLYVALCGVAIGCSLWLHGVGSMNLAWFLVLMAAFRIFFDVRLGRWVFGCAVVSCTVLIALLAFGVVDPNPLQPGLGERPHLFTRWLSATAALVGAWFATHYLAIRIRTTEHELRQLAATLEQRVQREVAERSRDLTEALLTLSRDEGEILGGQEIDGRYRVVRRVGMGGMGAVWQGERLADGHPVALKVLRSQSDPRVLARFAREAQIAARITHPNLVPVLDVVLAHGRLFLVMPLVADGSLEEHRAHFGDRAWARPLLAGIAAGLAALHARGVVHRDLKPGNVLVSGGVARITDLGIARIVGRATQPSSGADGADADASLDRTLDAEPASAAAPEAPAPTLLSDAGKLTLAGQLLGTPYYMAPELADLDAAATPAVDVFAFGIIAYEMLNGRRPFAEPPVLARRLGRPMQVATREACLGDDTADAMLAGCLEPDPSWRPSAAELAEALGHPSDSTPR